MDRIVRNNVCLSIYNNEVKMSPKEFLLYQTP